MRRRTYDHQNNKMIVRQSPELFYFVPNQKVRLEIP